MQAPFLILLHPCNFLFQSVPKHRARGADTSPNRVKSPSPERKKKQEPSPLLCPFVSFRISGGSQRIRSHGFLLDCLSSLDVCTNNSDITNDLYLPFTVDQSLDSHDFALCVWPHAHFALTCKRRTTAKCRGPWHRGVISLNFGRLSGCVGGRVMNEGGPSGCPFVSNNLLVVLVIRKLRLVLTT